MSSSNLENAMADEKQHPEDLSPVEPEAKKKGGLDDYLAAQRAEEAWLEKMQAKVKAKEEQEASDE
jgi:hypothetical protein